MIIPISGPNPSAARQAYLRWVRFFGPPDVLKVDLGREFIGAFEIGAELDSTVIEPSSLEMPTQRSITERAGKSFKEVFSRALMHHAVQSEQDWLDLVDITSMTTNRLMNKSGYSPIQRVLGYTPRLPGGLLTGGANDLSSVSRFLIGDVQMQKACNMRLAAAKAFHEADCSQALSNALHAGRRKPNEFHVGQVVYFWRKATEGVKKNAPRFWRGPARVVLTNPPTAVWCTFNGSLVKAAPEQLRSASPEELFAVSEWMDGLSAARDSLEKVPKRGYIDLTGEDKPPADTPPPEDLIQGFQPKHPIRGKNSVIGLTPKQTDTWDWDGNRLRRYHYAPRQDLFHPSEDAEGRPLDLRQLQPLRRTNMTNQKGEVRVVEDEWTDILAEADNPWLGTTWTGYTDFYLNTGDDTNVADYSTNLGPGVGAVPRPVLPELHPGDQGEPARITGDVTTRELEEPYLPTDDEEMEETHLRGSIRPADELGGEEEENPSKRLRTEYLDIYSMVLDKALAQKQKKEIRLRELQGDKKEKFLVAIKKEIQNNLNTGAYEIMSPEQSEQARRDHPDKILQSRYVLVEKGIEPEDIEKAVQEGILIADAGESSTKAKARRVMKGFSEWNAEDLETATPQVAKESMMLVLQLMSSNYWEPGYLDFTQAFHSGDAIDRTLFAEFPPEGIPNMDVQPRQLLRLKKTCYGLLDGPFAWFRHLDKLLKELGYVQSKGDPCVYYLFDQKTGALMGIIGVATDDLLHSGNRVHWAKMESIKGRYKLGKFARGSGRFAGKEIKYFPDGRIKVMQPLYVKEKIKEIPLSKERKRERMSRCDAMEINALRALLGALNMAFEGESTRLGRSHGNLTTEHAASEYPGHRVEANILEQEAHRDPEIGIVFYPIPLDRLRVGTVTDASWGNVFDRSSWNEEEGDFWMETEDQWMRYHIHPRRILFHPGSTRGEGPDLHHLQPQRWTCIDGLGEREDEWNSKDALRGILSEPWTGRTIFAKSSTVEPRVSDKFLQQARTSSQAGYILFFYDVHMETKPGDYRISVFHWKSFKLKRQTVNTLSAETQSMVAGVGGVHWQRFMLLESRGYVIGGQGWEEKLAELPFIAVTDSKSLYDTMSKCSNPATQVEDKRTAIDITILKNDMRRSKGQVRWIPGSVMISDALTKKMNAQGLRDLLNCGRWSLFEPDQICSSVKAKENGTSAKH